MRRILALATALAIAITGLSALPSWATAPVDGTYDCNTGIIQSSPSSPNFTISAGVLSAASSCVGAVVIPGGTLSIAAEAFRSASSVTSISIPDSVTSIGDRAFQSSQFTSITLPASVTSVSATAFQSNNNLATINFLGLIPAGWPWSAPAGVSVSGKVNCGTTGYFVIQANMAYARHNCTGPVVIPEGVTSIADQAFDADGYWGGVGLYGNYDGSTVPTNITSLVLPSTLTSIGDYAFRSLRASSLTIPDSVTSIGMQAFVGSSMATLIIGNGLTSIREWTFAGLGNLQNVTFGTGLRSIGDVAFAYNYNLSSVTIPDGVEFIGSQAFTNNAYPFTLNYCGSADLAGTNLPNPASNASTCRPAPVSAINAIPGNGSATIDFVPGIAGAAPITNFKYSLDGTNFTAFSPAVTSGPVTITGLTNGTTYDVSIKAVSSFGDSAASTISVTPRAPGLANVPSDGTYSCRTGLPSTTGQTYTIVNGNIPANSGSGCSGAVVVANGTTSLDYWAFGQAPLLTSVYLPQSVTSIQDYAFADDPRLIAINVASENANFSSVGGVLFNKTRTTLLKYPQAKTRTAYQIPTGVTRIEDFAFHKAARLSSVTIPSGVTTIGARAFQETGLTSVSIPEGVTSIAGAAFYRAYSLTSVTLPNSLTSLGDGVFAENSALTSINIPSGLTTIPARTFYYDGALTSITLPAGITAIGDEAFASATSLASINFPSSLRTIGQGALAGAVFTSATLPAGLTSIGDNAFQWIPLTTVSLPESLRTIGAAAFYGGGSLTSVTIPDGIETIGGVAFTNAGVTTLNYCGNASLAGTGLPSQATNAGSCRPAPPLALTATPGSGSATITFTPGATGGSSITGYKYSLNGITFTPFSPAVTSSTGTISGLTNGNSYTVYLKAVSSLGDSAASAPVTFVAGLSAFSSPAIGGVTAPALGEAPVTTVTAGNGYTGTVTWSGSPSTFGVGQYTATITLTANAGYTFSGVPANYFTVAGATSVTNSANSRVITAVFPQLNASPPSEPTQIVATRTSPTTATVSFVAPSSNGGSPVLSYTATAWPDGISSTLTQSGSGTISLSGLDPAESYIFEVFATNQGGNSNSAYSSWAVGANYDPATGNGDVPCATDGSVTGSGFFRITNNVVLYAVDCVGAVVIPQGVVTIGEESFWGNDGITSVSMGSSVTTIEDSAFGRLYDMTSLTIGSGVTSIGEWAFERAYSLTSLVIPDSVVTIGRRAFRQLYALTNLTIGNGVTTIGDSAFASLGNLTSISIGNSLTTIGESSFAGLESLTSITLPASLDSIDYFAFEDSYQLATVRLLGNAPSSVADYAFSGLPTGAEVVVGTDATGFGTDTTWNGLVLRRTEIQQNNNQQNNNQQSQPAALTPAFTFKIRPVVSTSGQSLTLLGENLASISSVKVSGIETKIIKRASGELVLDIQAGKAGFKDIVIVHSGGTLTMLNALNVVQPYSAKRTEQITGFKSGLPTKASLAALKKSYLASPTANIVTCVATVASNSTAKDVALATKAAKATCQAMTGFSSLINTVNVQVNKTGRAGSALTMAVTFDRSLTGK